MAQLLDGEEQEDTGKNKEGLTAIIDELNQELKVKTLKHAGINPETFGAEKEKNPFKEVIEKAPPKPVIDTTKAKGARSRIFDPVTSYIDGRMAYQQQNLSNMATIDNGRLMHQENMNQSAAKIDGERSLHLNASLDRDNNLTNQRSEHLGKSIQNDALFLEQRQNHLEKSIANHIKYLELDVEN